MATPTIPSISAQISSIGIGFLVIIADIPPLPLGTASAINFPLRQTTFTAVSKSIAAKNTSGLKFDFLFLDEGFGTLHKDAIGVVENALRSLSRETLVGIVTHRSELSELIPDKLIVDCATESEGSRVRIVS